MPRLLITGGTGYLGAVLVRQAVRMGMEVAATSHTQRIDHPGVHALALDLRAPDAIEPMIMDLRPDIIIHTAYLQSGPDLWAVTAKGAHQVARAAARSGARLIHLSSDVVFDGERLGNYTEDDPPSPITEYGRAKAAAETYVVEACPRALVVRTSLIYGGARPSNHEQLAIDAAQGRADLAFFSDEMRCPVQVDDLASALLELAVVDHRGRLHVAGTDTVSRYEFACLVVAANGYDPQRLRSARSADSGMRRPRNCALDTTLARTLLTTRLRGVREVLRSS